MKVISAFDFKYIHKETPIRVDEEVRHTITDVIVKLGYDDFELTSTEISKINALKDCAVNLSDAISITNYGMTTTERLSVVLGNVQGIVHGENLSALQNKLHELLVTMEHVTKYISSNSFVKLLTKKVDANTVDNLSISCSVKLTELNEDLKNYPTMFTELDNLFRKLSVYIISGHAFLMGKHIDDLTTTDIFKSQQINDINESIKRFERRLSSMETLRHSLLLQMVQIRIEKRNLEALIDNTFETLHVALPAWKQHIRNYELNKTSAELLKINELQTKISNFN